MSENSEKLRGALKRNVQASNDNIFVTGDSVYYKSACDRRWRRPARDLGKGSQQVLVKYGGIYVRCHPCRLALQKQNLYQKKTNKKKNQQQQQQHLIQKLIILKVILLVNPIFRH